MSITIEEPAVISLRQAVEETAGFKPVTHTAYSKLAIQIEDKCKEHISESTLERLWAYSTRSAAVASLRTLDVLSRFVGRKCWEDWCKWLKLSGQRESSELTGDRLNALSLRCGAILQLCWLPDRTVRLRHHGNARFEVVESINSSLMQGDAFICNCFQPGQPLYLDNFIRKGAETASRYVIGQNTGLCSVTVCEDA